MGMIVQTLSVLGREKRESLDEAIARRFEVEGGDEVWMSGRREGQRVTAPAGEATAR